MNKQKKILSFLFASKTELNLKLSGYNPESHNNFIHFSIENQVSTVKKQIYLSDSGTVSYLLIIDKKKEILIEYDEIGDGAQ